METKNCNFEREKCIGRGSFGKVYLCFDKKEPQKKFAMKTIDLEGSSEDERNSAEKEALLLTTLQHKYMLYALSVFQENETLCIVTEFCNQGDLAQFLEKRRGNLLEEERIVEWFRQICSALEYLHKKKVLHRDIKPQNIFLTGKEMTIKLGDLGLAKVLERTMEKASTFCGTPYYMSPEIVSGKPYNSKSDIWAMGVCIYEMTTLKRPFDARLKHQLHLKIANEQLPPIPKDEYSTLLINVIERMLCKDADSRPSATELLQDFLFKNQQTSMFQDEVLEVEEINKRNLARMIVRYVGNEGVVEKPGLRRLLQACIEFNQTEAVGFWKNASITIYDEDDNMYKIASGTRKHQFICRMRNGEPFIKSVLEYRKSFQDEVLEVEEINKRNLARMIVRYVGNEGVEKPGLRRLLQACIEFNQTEAVGFWKNASITIYDEDDNMYKIASGTRKHQFICRMKNGEPFIKSVLEYRKPKPNHKTSTENTHDPFQKGQDHSCSVC